jgi:hypothetical protein
MVRRDEWSTALYPTGDLDGWGYTYADVSMSHLLERFMVEQPGPLVVASQNEPLLHQMNDLQRRREADAASAVSTAYNTRTTGDQCELRQRLRWLATVTGCPELKAAIAGETFIVVQLLRTIAVWATCSPNDSNDFHVPPLSAKCPTTPLPSR